MTPEQFQVVATIPMISGSLSVIGSATIIFMIFRSAERLSSTYHRVLFGMSSMDIIYSFGYLLSTLPFPKETPSLWEHVYGNTTTCTIQGVMIFSGNIGANMYNCSLAIYYMLTITFGVKEEQMRKRFEPFFHAVPLLYLASTNTYLLMEKSFNAFATLCYITPYPRGCNFDPNVPCTRGENAYTDFWSLHVWPVSSMFFIIIFVMAKLYHTIRSQAIKMQRYQMSATTLPAGVRELRRSEMSSQEIPRSFWKQIICSERSSGGQGRRTPLARRRRDTMIQSFLYVLAYVVTYICVLIRQITIKGGGSFSYTLLVLTQITTPLQGFLNFMVFIRPRIVAFRRVDQDLPWSKAFIKAITSTGETTFSAVRRQSALLDTQGNGGRRYTAREFHLRETIAQIADDEELMSQIADDKS